MDIRVAPQMPRKTIGFDVGHHTSPCLAAAAFGLSKAIKLRRAKRDALLMEARRLQNFLVQHAPAKRRLVEANVQDRFVHVLQLPEREARGQKLESDFAVVELAAHPSHLSRAPRFGRA